MSSLPLQPKKYLVFWDFPMKNVVKILGLPMSSLGGVHLISGIAQFYIYKSYAWLCALALLHRLLG